jgi:hypothetical protein
MLSLDLAKRLSADDPKALVGKTLTLGYAARSESGDATPPTPLPQGLDVGGLQVRRVETSCAIVGIVERETGPAFAGAGGCQRAHVAHGEGARDLRRSGDQRAVAAARLGRSRRATRRSP